jgi:hypothetical protein
MYFLNFYFSLLIEKNMKILWIKRATSLVMKLLNLWRKVQSAIPNMNFMFNFLLQMQDLPKHGEL